MNDPQKLAALKKAYADTILNTAKEAAARVVVSERKARGYQQELVAVRDEALRTLLRLKQMFDSKVKEAEMMSLRQQNKIEELEAQLGEAEDIVGELRTELRELQAELAKVTSGQTRLHNEENPCCENDEADRLLHVVYRSRDRSEAVGSCIPVGQNGSAVANGIKNTSLNGLKNIRRCSYKNNGDSSHYTLPSILTRRRDTEVLKEECSKMIHALKHGITTEDLSASIELDDMKDKGPSCKSSSNQCVQTSQTSDCAIVVDSSCLLYNDVRDGDDSQALQNGSDSGSEEKVNHENTEISTSMLCEGSLASPSDKRFIKYTFKRKRKKDVLSSPDGDFSPDERRNNKNQKTGEKDNSYLESLKSSLIAESSRDSRRVAQVARQLVPLSEKKGLLQIQQFGDSLKP